MEIMIKSGIRGILNFSAVKLVGKEDTIIHNIYLQNELESLIYFVNASKRVKKTKDN
jgi:redox-sensing transcriptional repressor